MSDSSLKPWSLCEDESEAIDSADSPSSESARIDHDDTRDSDAWSGEKVRFRPSALNLSPYWSLGVFSVALGWCIWGMLSAPTGTGLTRGSAFAVLLLTVLGLCLLIGATLGRRTAIAKMLHAVKDGFGKEQAAGGVIQATELGPVWHAIEEHSENINRRVNELLNAHRQMSMELTLAGAQRRLSAGIFGTLPDPLLVLDSYGQLIQANAAAEQLFGFNTEECLRTPIDSIIVHDELRKVIRQARESDQRVAERRAEFVLTDKYYGAHIVPLAQKEKSSEANAEHGMVVLLRDITRERDASRKKSEFVAHVAHELRTPLSSIRAYVEMLVDGEAADEATRKEYYDIIHTSADRLGRLIDNMLNISRIEAGTVRINKEPISISMVVKEACDIMRPSAEEKKIKLTEHLTPVVFRILADRDLLYQSVLNLISNAVKYTPEGGEVTVRMTPHEEKKAILVEIQDTGVGIPKEDLPRMFQKFFRVEANKGMAKGTGLGLNLVKNIVETVHGGQITLSSEVGKGSTFGMVLPLMT